MEFTIINYHIREEFDAVKNYFINVLRTKKIEVYASIQVGPNEIILIEAYSPEVEKIDENTLRAVRLQWIKQLTQKKVQQANMVLTMEELFESVEEKGMLSTTFFSDEQSLADDPASVAGSIHYYNLRYLSSRHAARVMRLRFILNPFSFLFLLEGEEYYHLIWETLDTEEATYLWRIEKDVTKLKMAVGTLAHTISLLKAQGKKTYLSTSSDDCTRIFHHYNLGIEGFVKWKNELEACIS
jgi:hypothetical protein